MTGVVKMTGVDGFAEKARIVPETINRIHDKSQEISHSYLRLSRRRLKKTHRLYGDQVYMGTNTVDVSLGAFWPGYVTEW